ADVLLNQIHPILMKGNKEDLNNLESQCRDINEKYQVISNYFQLIGEGHATEDEIRELNRLIAVAHDLNGLVDLIGTQLAGLGRARLYRHIDIKSESQEGLEEMLSEMRKAFGVTISAITDPISQKAEQVLGMAPTIQNKFLQLHRLEANILKSPHPDRLEEYALMVEMLDKYRWVWKRIRRLTLEAVGYEEEIEASLPDPIKI
ncbi:hypothetical protein ACQZV8_21800, partial [Magnetococcales bacterium HHB-1]